MHALKKVIVLTKQAAAAAKHVRNSICMSGNKGEKKKRKRLVEEVKFIYLELFYLELFSVLKVLDMKLIPALLHNG